MDKHSTSLSLALEMHDLIAGERLPTSPRQNGHTGPRLSDNNSSYNFNNCRNSGDWSSGAGCNIIADTDFYDEFQQNFPEKFTYDAAQKLLDQISSKDLSMRRVGLEILSNVILSWVHKRQSDGVPVVNLFDSNSFTLPCDTNVLNSSPEKEALDGKAEGQEDCTARNIMQQAVASILRLSVRCPFVDVRHKCEEILIDLRKEKIQIPTICNKVSRFIPNDEIQPVDTDDEQTYSLYMESFIHNCRLEHMVMVMAMHPQYLHLFLTTNYHLLHSKGMLPDHYRSYIAIMAAARHKCSYLVHLMEAHFLLQGGDRQWLKGMDYAPPKLRALSTLNKLLAHRPWLVTPAHIKDLLETIGESRWQHPELAQAIVLLCHFHSLAIFCLGTGVNLEIDHEVLGNSVKNPKSVPSTPLGTESALEPSLENFSTTTDIELLMERMKKLGEEEEEVTREEMDRRFEREKQEASHVLLPEGGPTSGSSSSYFAKYVMDPDFGYQDFAKRDGASEIPTFRAQDYNWDDHASLMISNYYSEVADVLDEKFKVAKDLTYHTLGSKADVDTTSLRRAIWKYVHCMYGIMYDDYNYGEVNQLLDRPLKVFIKTVSCFPEKTKRSVYGVFWKQFHHSEKVHVTMMLLESRLQVGLLYGMRALTQTMTDR